MHESLQRALSRQRRAAALDWSMIAQEERFPKLFSSRPFPDVMIFFLKAVGYSDLQIEGIMLRNAVRFLGLGKAERERFGEILCGPQALQRLDEGFRLGAESAGHRNLAAAPRSEPQRGKIIPRPAGGR